MKKLTLLIAALFLSSCHTNPVKREPSQQVGTAKVKTIKRLSTYYSVQIKSFDSEDSAYEYAGKMSDVEGLQVIPAEINGATWYRIIVGRSPSRKKMKALRDNLATRFNDSTFFVRKIQE